MASDKQYNIVLQKYNLAVAKAKDLQEQLVTKTEQWQKLFTEFETTQKLMRELCETILAKSPSQNQLGKSTSWDSLEMNEMINLSKKVLREYDTARTNLMNKVADDNEERRNRIAELEEEVQFYKSRSVMAEKQSNDDYNDFEEDIPDADDFKDESEQSNKTTPDLNNLFAGSNNKTSKNTNSDMNNLFATKSMNKQNTSNVDTSKLSPKMQDAVKSGDVILQYVKEAKEEIKNGTAIIEYEDADEEVVEGEKIEELHKSNYKNNITSRLTNHSMQVIHSPKANAKKKKMRQEVENEVVSKELKNIISRISEDNWKIIKIIGDTGYSTVKDITGLIIDEFLKEKRNISSRQSLAKITDLSNIGVLSKYELNTPLKGNFSVVTFTAEGALIYKSKFNKTAEISECDKIIQEHTTLEHGYGILHCADIIKNQTINNKEIFKDVSIWNRKKAISVKSTDNKSNITYVPDIICEDNDGNKIYIEYELDHHTKQDFNAKCNKMLALGFTRINFLAPNIDTAKSLCERLKNWIETKGSSNIIKNLTLRVTTAKALDGHDIRKDSEWMFTYKPGRGSDFIKNF